jgi:ATP synthase mitochondrial F1 complex assembly factor 2
MTAMERATYATKSFIIALALVKGHLTVEQAALAAQVEVSSQIERWGEVEDSKCCIIDKCHKLNFASTAHDVDFHDVRRQLGAAACLLSHI